ncbi:unnamed protein product [Larinioides sclopetarius]|uniref:Uncharacterized protein n=1 Tax=Larinioides sclopetarius TaxID=280406 RepID=A0AAV1ZZD7_9ARAC
MAPLTSFLKGSILIIQIVVPMGKWVTSCY